MSRRVVPIKGAASLRRVLRQAPAEMSQELRTAIAEGAETVEAEMRARVPVRTGKLEASISTKMSRDGMAARVGPGVAGKRAMRSGGWKARFAEFGTKHHAAQPFVFPAWRAKEPEIRERIRKGAKAALLKIAKRGSK